ncbi:hypothetical protein AX16_000385 [Volvariella volvacea WC 439]|nr:hypothetical protein AX16_000385 [Volvariella volvacea WC 439]
MDVSVRRKVIVKVLPSNSADTSRPPSRESSRPPSPIKTPMTPISTNDSEHIFRPRAKVNSSATISSRKTPSVISTTSTRPSRQSQENQPSNSSNPRALSPARTTPRSPNSTLSPTIPAKARATVIRSSLRPQTPESAPATPQSRHRPTASELGIGRVTDPKPRNVSLHHVNSLSSLHVASVSSRPSSPTLPGADNNVCDNEIPLAAPAPIRIKARVSIIKSLQEPGLPSSPTQPHHPSGARSVSSSLRTRSPSISSSVSASPAAPNVFYPITTASPAANPHRYATPRPAVRTQQLHPQKEDLHVNSPRHSIIVAKVDPASIPLPPQSPSASAVSFSSRSSASRSSVSHNAESDSQSSVSTSQNDHTVVSSLSADKTRPHSKVASDHTGTESGLDLDDSDDEEYKVRAEAKSNRKIADLEITNRSLMAINSTLETMKHKQAKEIRELRRKLRESRLILPPRQFRAVKSTLDDGNDTEETEDEGDEEGDGDEIYKRVKHMLESLIETGRSALEAKIPSVSTDKPVAKVLSADELRNWRASSGASSDGEATKEDDDDDGREKDENVGPIGDKLQDARPTSKPRSPSPFSHSRKRPQLSGRLSSYSRLSRPSSPAPPPILITESA